MSKIVKKEKTETTLDKIIKEIPTSTLTQEIREFCDLIMKEESSNITLPQYAPSGPNKFLVIEVDGPLRYQRGFLTLEREAEEDYVGVFWTLRLDKKDSPLRKYKVHTIEGNSAKKIMYQFAKLVKLYRGE